jgi:hypothetical protein
MKLFGQKSSRQLFIQFLFIKITTWGWDTLHSLLQGGQSHGSPPPPGRGQVGGGGAGGGVRGHRHYTTVRHHMSSTQIHYSSDQSLVHKLPQIINILHK